MEARVDSVLEVEGLVRNFGAVRAVDGLGFSVRAGEVYGFLGRNGAGKTTTIRMLMGMTRPDAGAITILGRRGARPTPASKRLIGYVAQEQHFYPWMTCVALGDFVASFYPTWDAALFARLLESFELPPRRRVSELSHGMRVKLALALAIAPRPPLLILDEPTAGLDPVARREFLELVELHARPAGQTVFFSSHIMEEVERVADRVGIIDRGRLLFEGELAALKASVRAVAAAPLEVAEPAAALPEGFRVLRALDDGRALMFAAPERWDAHPELTARASSPELTLDDLFVVLVSRVRVAS